MLKIIKVKIFRSIKMKKDLPLPFVALGSNMASLNPIRGTTKLCYDNSSSRPLQFRAKTKADIKDLSVYLNKSPTYDSDTLDLDFKDFVLKDVTNGIVGYNIFTYFLPSGADIFNSKWGIMNERLGNEYTSTTISGNYDVCPNDSYSLYYNNIPIRVYGQQSASIDIKNYKYDGKTFNGIGGDVKLFIELERAYTEDHIGSFYI